MASQVGDVQLAIGASLGDLRVTIDQANKILENFSKTTSRGFREPAAHADGLGGSVRDLKREMVQGDRVAGFFSGKLASIVPASSLAGEGLKTITSAVLDLSGGLTKMAAIGVGIEVATLAITAIVHAINSEAEALKAAREEAKRHAEALEKIQGIRDRAQAAGLAPGGEKEQAELASRTQAEMRTLARERRAAEDLRDEAVKKREYTTVVRQQTRIGEIAKEQKALGDLYAGEANRIARERIAAQEKGENAVALAQTLGEEERIRVDYGNRINEIHSEIALHLRDEKIGSLEITRLEIERTKALEAIANKQQAARFLAPKKSLEEIDAGLGADYSLSGRGADELAQLKARQAHEPPIDLPVHVVWVGEDGKPYDSGETTPGPVKGSTAALEAESYASVEIAMAGTTEAHLAASEAAKQHAKDVQDAVKAYQEMGAVGGAALAGLLTGQETLQGAMKQVLAMAAKQIITAAFTASANSAVPGALAGGPIGAAAAMAATQALVLGLIASLPSARGGWDVPNDTLAYLHKDEKVISQKSSRKIDRMIDNASGGGGGPTINLNATYVDRPGFDRLTRDVTREQRRLARQTRTG